MSSEARFVKAMLREYELCVNLLGSRGCSWSASAPVDVSVGSWKFVWSWKLLGSGRELELGAGTQNGSWILFNINLTLELEIKLM